MTQTAHIFLQTVPTNSDVGLAVRIYNSFVSVIEQLIAVLPNLVGAFLILLIGWLLAKLISSIIGKILARIGLDALADKLNQTDTFRENNIRIKPVSIIQRFIYWTFMLVFFLSAAETLGLDIVTAQISALIQYIPQLFTSVIIMAFGFYASDAIKSLVANSCRSFGIPAWKIISNIIFYILLVAISITALNQAGINTDIITSNIYIILGGLVLAFAIAYGFAARNVLASILTAFYVRGNFQLGQMVELEGYKGVIIKMDSVSLTLDTGNEQVVFPLSRLINDKVIIHKSPSNRIES